MDLKYISIGGIAWSVALLLGMLLRQFPEMRWGLLFLIVLGGIAIATWIIELAVEHARASEDWETGKFVALFAAGVAGALLLSGLVGGIYAGG
jgi:hypothetical protein